MANHEYEEVHLNDDDDEDIELVGSGGGGGDRRQRAAPSTGSGGGTTSSSTKWIIILFLIALIGVYKLGMEEGKSEVQHEGLLDNNNGGGGGGGDSEGGRVRTRDNNYEDKKDSATAAQEEQPQINSPETTTTTTTTTTLPPKAPMKFTMDQLHLMRTKCTDLINELNTYYSSPDQATAMLLNSYIEPWDFAEVELDHIESTDESIVNDTPQRQLRAMKLVNTMLRALVTDDQRVFLMGGIGSSVMAGHDNCHYDSYESQMERLFAPIWQAADMEFTFQNAGEGGGCGDSYENQVWCVKQNISPNVDVVHYEWTYFEHGRAHSEHESLIRWIQMLPKQPPLHIFNTGENDKNGNDVKLVEYYAMYGFNAFYMKTGFENGGYDYEKEKREKEIDRFSWGKVGDGYHNTTRYGELEEDDLRKASLGVVMRNWHPGPMGFQLTSDSFTYVYTHAILKALDIIEKEVKDGKDPREKWDASTRPIFMKDDLPEPMFCDPMYCVVDEPPGCLNYELPTFGQWGPRVEDPDDDLNPYLGEVQNWKVWHKDNDLWYMVGKQDTSLFKKRDDAEMCRHLDACGGITAKKVEDGMVVFRLPKMEVGLVVVCGCCGKDVGQKMFMDNEKLEISFNTVPLNKTTFDVWPNKKCVRLLKKFPTSGRESETPTGHHYLALKILEDSTDVKISHVFTI